MSTSVLWNSRPSDVGRQIVMFPFLGGFGASFNGLTGTLEEDWDVWTVNPPGHGSSTLPPVHRLDDLVDLYLGNLRDVLKPGAVFFGHSMGSVVAYHVLLAMAADAGFAGRRPTDLVLSASAAPRHLPVQGYGALPEDELIRHLRSFGTFPEEVVQDADLMAMLVPAFRADYQVLEDARRRPVTLLDVRTRLILGALDSQTPAGSTEAWQDYLAAPIRHHLLADQGHMYVLDAPARVGRILDELSGAAVGAS
ncbi:thioesterase II family protein [Myceligenerans xiligouense]|uniref:External thioesterase TEII n=1 Tax=Myceligenerans xiligouense TaxID=253184 RepID=A0A3N4YRT1_9MICO|nr:alpha/beta fold hydrolase [Myceligenerans xiligouense]RPF22276.1 external thioesterase TEII [Myceligenerans xiligouense]